MLEILLYVLAALAILVALILAIASRRPDSFRTERSLVIAAPPERIYPLIIDLKAMNTWNPFALRDPASKVSYSDPANGVGARHTFDGKTSGAGWIEVTKAEPNKAVAMRLFMTRPFKADNTVEFNLTPATGGTNVSWAMSGKQILLSKVMSMFIDCDRMIGREFETGLATLKQKAEG